jgi:hypothetical protein
VATKEPRHLCWRAEQVCWASNALQAHSHPVNPTLIRTLFDALHLCTDDRGNQWIGDVLGNHGLHLSKDRQGNYILPEGGIEPELIVQWFIAPIDYKWDYDCKKYFPAAAALPPATASTPKKAKKPRPDTRAVSAAWAEIAETRRGLSRLGETLSSTLAELRGVARALREALLEGPTLAEAEAGLRLAEQLLRAAEGLADEMPPAD